jgi:phosphate transport system substrate-binding protein
MHKTQADAAKGREVIKFFAWAYKNGAAMADELDYIVMPPAVVKLVEDSWKANLKDAAGKQL